MNRTGESITGWSAADANGQLMGASDPFDLRVTLPSQPVTIQVDAARLAQIVGNLLGNAAKFTDRGGVIELKVQIVSDSVLITVSDSGIGINPQHLPHVFDLYMQADSSLGRSSTGIGLGLALVKELVALHGGSVAVSSPGVGMGSTFVVRLPHHTHSPVSSAEAATTSATPERTNHVLVVDDNCIGFTGKPHEIGRHPGPLGH